ncbi:MAG: phosphotransferase family protein [Candidatus Helarchaeota archaeon]
MTRPEDLLQPIKEQNSPLQITEPKIKQYISKKLDLQVEDLAFTRFPNGIVNDVFKIDCITSRGSRSFVLKFCSDRFDGQKNLREFQILKNMEKINLPVPEILFFDASRTSWNRDVICWRYVDGIPLSELINTRDDACYSIIDQLQQVLKKLHAKTKTAHFGISIDEKERQKERHDSYFAFVFKLVFDKMPRLQELQFPIEPFRDFFLRVKESFNEISLDHALCHRDVTPLNVIVHPKTHEILAILDWEFAWYSHPTLDIASTYYRLSNYWQDLADYFKKDYDDMPLLPLYILRRGLLTCSTYFYKQNDMSRLNVEFNKLKTLLLRLEKDACT